MYSVCESVLYFFLHSGGVTCLLRTKNPKCERYACKTSHLLLVFACLDSLCYFDWVAAAVHRHCCQQLLQASGFMVFIGTRVSPLVCCYRCFYRLSAPDRRLCLAIGCIRVPSCMCVSGCFASRFDTPMLPFKLLSSSAHCCAASRHVHHRQRVALKGLSR